MSNEVRLRFAPSPTGYLHIGGLRTALYNYIFAKGHGGSFLLRIEDTDRTRYVEGAIENLLKELEWAGIKCDEGVAVDDNGNIVSVGNRGPYIQSERVKQGIYDKYIDELLEKGYAYYCFCSKERLDHLKESQRLDGLMPKYDGLCRGISLEEAKKKVAAGEKYVIRLRLPADRDIVFNDSVKGKVSINTNDMDDQVLIKSDGFPTYHFAVVVDDHLMGITHVVRGDEWLSSTPKHVFLYEAFGWKAPTYVHLPTVLNKSGKKLSKRNDDVSVEDFRNMGYLPEGLINYLALVGWAPDSEKELFTMNELKKEFDFNRISSSGGIFDKNKLNWVNGHYIRAMEDKELALKIKPYLIEAGYVDEDVSEEFLEILATTFKDSLDTLKDISTQSKFIFDEDIVIEEEDAKEMASVDFLKDLLTAFSEELESIDIIDEEFAKGVMKNIQKKTGIKGKNLYMPIRAVLTGNVHGPELYNIIRLLGKEKILKRFKNINIKK